MRRLAIGVALLLAACQAGPAPRAPKAAALSPVERLRAEGEAFLAKADYADAIEKYRQAADLDPTAVAPRFGLGTAYSFLDKRPEAIVQFRKVLEHNPTHYGATFQLATALDMAGKRAEARPLWEKMLQMAEASKDIETADKARARLHSTP